MNASKRKGGHKLRITWNRLPEESDIIRELLKYIPEDMRGVLEKFLHISGRRNLEEKKWPIFLRN